MINLDEKNDGAPRSYFERLLASYRKERDVIRAEWNKYSSITRTDLSARLVQLNQEINDLEKDLKMPLTKPDAVEKARICRRMMLVKRSCQKNGKWTNDSDAHEYESLVWESMNARERGLI